MQSAGTDAARPSDQAELTFRANLDALRARIPESAKLIESAAPPTAPEYTLGRDGTATFAWTDNRGQRRWLGESTIPAVCESVLVEQFEPGAGNVILSGIGHGTAIRLMARSLRVHQAIFVVEPDAWRAECALRLHAFEELLRRHRLLLFVGRDAWDQLNEYLVESPGLLVPDRTLAWPWLSRGDVRTLTERLTAMQVRAANARSTATPPIVADIESSDTMRVFIGSNAPDDVSHRWARSLERAVRDAGGTALCCVPDSPTMMHPAAIERRIASVRPTMTILLDCTPAQLAFRSPNDALWVIVTHTNAIPQELLRQLPISAQLLVRTNAQRRAAIAGGADEKRVAIIHPGVGGKGQVAGDASSHDRRIFAFADWHGADPEDVGVHLGSHQRLWRTARDWIVRNTDRYHDELAADAFAHAESATNLRIQSDEVRFGLINRIRTSLGPRIVAEELLTTLARSNAALTIRGRGWEKHALLAEFATNAPQSDAPSIDLIDGNAPALVWTGTTHQIDDRVLNWMAHDRPVFLRRIKSPHVGDPGNDGWEQVIDIEQHVAVFCSTGELAKLLSQFMERPSDFLERAAVAGKHLREHHTWRHRLMGMLQTR